MEKFGNLVVSMVFRTGCNHCLCLYTFLSFACTPYTCIHVHSLGFIYIFTRLIMPQVKNLGGCCCFVGDCFYSRPSPRGSLCTWIVLQAWWCAFMKGKEKKLKDNKSNEVDDAIRTQLEKAHKILSAIRTQLPMIVVITPLFLNKWRSKHIWTSGSIVSWSTMSYMVRVFEKKTFMISTYLIELYLYLVFWRVA